MRLAMMIFTVVIIYSVAQVNVVSIIISGWVAFSKPKFMKFEPANVFPSCHISFHASKIQSHVQQILQPWSQLSLIVYQR